MKTTLTTCLNRTRIYLPYSTPVYSFVSSKDTILGTLHEKKPLVLVHIVEIIDYMNFIDI